MLSLNFEFTYHVILKRSLWLISIFVYVVNIDVMRMRHMHCTCLFQIKCTITFWSRLLNCFCIVIQYIESYIQYYTGWLLKCCQTFKVLLYELFLLLIFKNITHLRIERVRNRKFIVLKKLPNPSYDIYSWRMTV